MTTAYSDELLEKILQELKTQNSSEKEIWTVDDIAQYLTMSKSNVQNRITKHDTFPLPIKIPTQGEFSTHPRWVAAEVKEWVKRFKTRKTK